MPKVHSINVPSLDVRAQILSIYGRRTGVGQLAPLGHDPFFDLTARNLCKPSISDVVLRQIICQTSPPARGQCVMAAPSPPGPFATWRVEAFFFSAAFLSGGVFELRSICADA